MNRLDPDLKRLMKWSRRAPESLPSEAPPGFSGRVVARREVAPSASPLSALHKLASIAAWASALVIVCGVLFLVSQARAPKLATDFSSAAQFLASNLVP